MSIGKRLKILRIEHGLTLDELASKINITKATLSRYENDHRKPNAEFIEAITRFYGVSSDYILGVAPVKKDIPVVYDEYIEVIQSAKRRNISASKLKSLLDFLDAN